VQVQALQPQSPVAVLLPAAAPRCLLCCGWTRQPGLTAALGSAAVHHPEQQETIQQVGGSNQKSALGDRK
jgi:hypothetical protein